MARRSSSFLLAALLLAAALPAQRPKTAEQALAKYERMRDDAEGERWRAAADLGPFDDRRVTAILLAELERAESESYRRTVIRALGQVARPEPAGVVPALARQLRSAVNARLCDAAGEALGRQGAGGVAVLGAELDEPDGMRRDAACRGLGKSSDGAARDFLIAAARRWTGRERIEPLEALATCSDSAAVDDLRRTLAGDKDHLVAAEAVAQLARHRVVGTASLALELARRLPAKADAGQRAAVLHGLLLEPIERHFEPILVAAAGARDAFDVATGELWRDALRDHAFGAFLIREAPRRKLAPERAAAAAALVFVPLEQRGLTATALVKMLADKDEVVVRAAADALVTVGGDRAEPALRALLGRGPAPRRALAAAALQRRLAANAAWHDELCVLATDRAPALRVTALRLLARCEPPDVAAAIAAAGASLDHKAWTVRAAAIDLLAALRHKDGIPLLIERVGVEQARLAEDLAGALQILAGLRLPDQKAWRSWWQQERERHVVPAPRRQPAARRSGQTAASYWDIPVRSDRVAFVVDTSGSMKKPFGTAGTCLDEAKRQLVRVLGMLGPQARANIIAFHHDATAWENKLQKLDKKRRAAGEAFTTALDGRGGTDVHAAMELAFTDPDVDTIFLLTDGRPSAGRIMDPDLLAAAIAAWNLDRGIRIHTVSIGGRSDFLERLARESGGEHSVAR